MASWQTAGRKPSAGGGAIPPSFLSQLFSKDSRCRQTEVDDFFRNKPALSTRCVESILDSSVGMQRRGVSVLKKTHLVHITNELRRLYQHSHRFEAFGITALVYCLQATVNDDAQTSGEHG